MLIPFPTQRSIQTARAVMLAERAQATAQVGLHFVMVRCPHCPYEADGTGVTDAQAEQHAIKEIIRHLVKEHGAA